MNVNVYIATMLHILGAFQGILGNQTEISMTGRINYRAIMNSDWLKGGFLLQLVFWANYVRPDTQGELRTINTTYLTI